MKLFPHLIFFVGFCVVFFHVLEFLKLYKIILLIIYSQNQNRPSSVFFMYWMTIEKPYFDYHFFFIWWTLISTSLLILHFFVSALINVLSHFYEPECRVDTDCSQQYQYGYSKNAKARFKIESNKNLRYNRSIVFIFQD